MRARDVQGYIRVLSRSEPSRRESARSALCSRWESRSAAVGGLYLRPAATGRGVNISSKSNDDLAELAAVLQIAVHFHHLVELECTIDDRLERATREAPGDVLHCDLPACLVARY